MFERIRSLLAVISEGGANRAAQRLGITQPTLSRHIQSLEQEIGGLLFERDTRGMRPTALGYFARDRYEPLLREYEQIQAEVAAHAQGRHTQLRIGYLGLAATKFLNPALPQLKAEFPDTKLMLFDQTPSEQLKALREGRLDIAIAGQEAAAQADDFYQRRVATLGVVAAVPFGHSLAKHKEISLAQLQAEQFIGPSEKTIPGRVKWMSDLCSKAGYKPRFIARTDSVSETFTLIASENAVTLLPDYLDGPPPPGIAYLRLSDKWAKWNLVLLRQRGKGSLSARRLVELINEIRD